MVRVHDTLWAGRPRAAPEGEDALTWRCRASGGSRNMTVDEVVLSGVSVPM